MVFVSTYTQHNRRRVDACASAGALWIGCRLSSGSERRRDPERSSYGYERRHGFIRQRADGRSGTVHCGEPRAGHLAGRIYAALPDAARSVIAGDFDAEVRPAQARPP